jgi:hypothetical protein
MSEDKYLCIGTQKNINAGVFVNGLLHPEMELGPLHFQKTVREVVMEHRKKEEEVGHEIWPAAERTPQETSVSEEPVAFEADAPSYLSEKNDFNVTVTPLVSV